MNLRYILTILILPAVLSITTFLIFGTIVQAVMVVPTGVACGLSYTHDLDKKATVYILNTINKRIT